MSTPDGQMRLREAVELRAALAWACACVGGPSCCFVRYREATALHRLAAIAARLVH